MKALEKAAKDRGEARTEPDTTATPAESRPELSLALELLAADTPSPRLKEDRQSKSGSSQRPAVTGFPREPAHAAAAMQAGGDAGIGIGAYVHDHPLIIFGIIAALFAIGFGGYVYLQIFHPGFLIRPVPATNAPPQIVQAPAPAAAPSAAAPQPLPAAPLLQAPAPTASPEPPEPATAPVPPKPAAAAPAQKPESKPPPRDAIVVSRGDATSSVNPLLAEAYAALQAGRLEAATQLYAQLARAEPKSVDALLGLAAIAVQDGRTDDAGKHYLAILELNPRHALAQSGLIGLMGRADPLAAESHLKQLITREPSAFLFFTLGNVYADQGLWAQAQQAYFQAHHLEPHNPDYAYNLAVGLDHISQPRLAVGFYRRALELASARSHVNFDPARARERIATLATQLE
ncbi:MAG: tetratricopeptide repeat protein [Betaproteobacteria bacterium]|nr:tetratricopeptide repeat protein [Betaproteobacteria bacterium]